jgi:hypothetical protein
MAEATLSGEDLARFRAALEKILDRWRRLSNAWRPRRTYPSPYGEGWHQGFHTALAELADIAGRALDPEGSALSDDLNSIVNSATDREWFEKTGNCGHCGQLGGDCICTPDDPCGCGPHEPRTWPVKCYTCDGTGMQDPIRRKP